MLTAASTILVVLLALLQAPGAGADEVADLERELEEARRELTAVQERLDAAAVRLGELEARVAELSDEQAALTARLEELAGEIAAAEERVADRVRSVYKRGRVDPMMVLLSGADPDEALGQAAVVASLVRDDVAEQEVAAARREEALAVAARLEESRRELDEALAAQQEVLADLEADLERARTLERRLERERDAAEQRKREEERRRREAEAAAARQRAEERSQQRSSSTPPASSGYVCPVAKPHSFTDTWGAPRSGGRRHEGTDILAPRGAHIYAVTSGYVDIRGYGSSAGYWLILRGSDGTHYYYMHLDGYAVGSGPVSSGQLIGYNGDTGNASGTPHLHFEQHPGGGAPINPYPFLRGIC